jgi:class 3 adenylate cyclase
VASSTAIPSGRLGPPESYTPRHLVEKILTSKAALEGERKQVTVLFADLKGSMEMLADRDPEEARKLLDPVLEHMMEAVHRYEGTVNQVMGDGVMALFGLPSSSTRRSETERTRVRKSAEVCWSSEFLMRLEGATKPSPDTRNNLMVVGHSFG